MEEVKGYFVSRSVELDQPSARRSMVLSKETEL